MSGFTQSKDGATHTESEVFYWNTTIIVCVCVCYWKENRYYCTKLDACLCVAKFFPKQVVQAEKLGKATTVEHRADLIVAKLKCFSLLPQDTHTRIDRIERRRGNRGKGKSCWEGGRGGGGGQLAISEAMTKLNGTQTRILLQTRFSFIPTQLYLVIHLWTFFAYLQDPLCPFSHCYCLLSI